MKNNLLTKQQFIIILLSVSLNAYKCSTFCFISTLTHARAIENVLIIHLSNQINETPIRFDVVLIKYLIQHINLIRANRLYYFAFPIPIQITGNHTILHTDIHGNASLNAIDSLNTSENYNIERKIALNSTNLQLYKDLKTLKEILQYILETTGSTRLLMDRQESIEYIHRITDPIIDKINELRMKFSLDPIEKINGHFIIPEENDFILEYKYGL